MSMFERTALGFGCLLVIACGTAAGDDDGVSYEEGLLPGEVAVSNTPGNDSNEPPANVAKQEVLAEIEVDGEVVTFLRLGEGTDATLAMTSRGSISNQSPLQGLIDRDGALTFLETFQALAPDALPPEALVQSHPVEAAAMNRDDQRVRSVDKNVPPPGVNVCDDSLFYFTPLTWTNVTRGGALSGGDAYICVSNTGSGGGQVAGGQPSPTVCTFATTLRKMAGLCNRGTANMSSFAGFGSATTWSTTASESVPTGEYIRWDAPASTTPQRLAAVGISSFGGGASYGLRSGTAE
jgi:hypothetical protein